ncbi:hypothetical protein MLD38_012846 [Melastoma candidum]|uniref:Uncharacterized protein n=1 Tax=Melastoma candidum TaxID=119954 RepID=A0ACB9R7W2_9MYRT|nr:hypothetical protein MLD38_012846 [Melastoma candidum]
MSRCFPYKGGAVTAGAIRGTPTEEPIKLQKERLRIHGTEKRSQNKKKRDDNGTSHKPTDVVRVRTIRFVNKGSEAKKLSGGDLPDGKGKSDFLMRISKLKEDSCESVVTEEQGQPISPTSHCSLSITSKDEQTKDASQPIVEKRGSVIRIRLSRKQPGGETSPSKSPAEVVTSSSQDSRGTTNGHGEVASTSAIEPGIGPFRSKSTVLEPEGQYELLLDQWVPMPLGLESDESEDLDWLLGTKSSDGRCSKRLKTGVEGNLPLNTFSGRSWPPQATYLPGAEIHALPYTVLF